jgi:hypothetical protein
MDFRDFQQIKDPIAKAPAEQVLNLEEFIRAHVARQLAAFDAATPGR